MIVTPEIVSPIHHQSHPSQHTSDTTPDTTLLVNRQIFPACTMPSLNVPTKDRSGAPHKNLACATCQQRKVKCDREVPCSNCVNHHITCVPVTQPRPRRRRLPERELLDRLRKYEDLLRHHKIDFEPLHGEEQLTRPLKGTSSSPRDPPGGEGHTKYAGRLGYAFKILI